MNGKLAGKSRLELLDLARGLALVAMAIYHFAWDLGYFGYTDSGLTTVGGWKIFARCIASSFLIMVGFSLYLAHARHLRLRPFLFRLALVAGAALAITLVTGLTVPGGLIFFGILHHIALASVLGLLFLRWPWPLTLVLAALVIAAPWYIRSEFFAPPFWWWVGLSPVDPRSNDYVPLFPWFGAVLVGIALARLATNTGILARANVPLGGWSTPLQFIGRHSLIFYLVHQPVLMGIVYLASLVAPPAPISQVDKFSTACEISCENIRDELFCAQYCLCMLDRLDAENGLDAAFSNSQDAEQTAMLNDIAGMCTFEADNSPDAAPGEAPASE